MVFVIVMVEFCLRGKGRCRGEREKISIPPSDDQRSGPDHGRWPLRPPSNREGFSFGRFTLAANVRLGLNSFLSLSKSRQIFLCFPISRSLAGQSDRILPPPPLPISPSYHHPHFLHLHPSICTLSHSRPPNLLFYPALLKHLSLIHSSQGTRQRGLLGSSVHDSSQQFT